MEEREKPPIGLIPKYVRDKERMIEIIDACMRYTSANKTVPLKWLEELYQLINQNL